MRSIEGSAGHETGEGERATRESIVLIRQRFNYLTEMWLYGEMPYERYIECVSGLVACDEAGQQWSISPATGNWCRLTEEGAVIGDPPPFLYTRPEAVYGQDSPAEDEGVGAFCERCGAEQRADAAFCTHCGARLRTGGTGGE